MSCNENKALHTPVISLKGYQAYRKISTNINKLLQQLLITDKRTNFNWTRLCVNEQNLQIIYNKQNLQIICLLFPGDNTADMSIKISPMRQSHAVLQHLNIKTLIFFLCSVVGTSGCFKVIRSWTPENVPRLNWTFESNFDILVAFSAV